MINKNKVNRELTKLTVNKYFPEIPLTLIGTIFKSLGLDTSCLNGIYCGQSGESHDQIVGTNLWFRMTWYKMPSGKYEIVCYVS